MNPSQKKQVLAMAATGSSHREIAERIGVSHVTVGKYLRGAGVSRNAGGRAEVPPPAETPAPDPSEAPPAAIEIVRELISKSRAEFRSATELGNANAARHFARTAAGLMPVLARLEREQNQDEHVLRIPRTEIAEAMGSVREKLAAIASRPLLCAHCSRQLSVEWGTSSLPEGGK